MFVRGRGCKGVDYSQPAWDGPHWRAFVNNVMNLFVD